MSDRARGNLFVVLQFAVLAILAVSPRGDLWAVTDWVDVAGWIVAGVGLLILLVAGTQLGSSLTAHPMPRTNARLRETGLYAVVRHPIYLGLVLIGFGLLVLGASIVHFVALAALVATLLAKSRFEERFLRAQFPEYEAYSRRVGRIIPRVDRLFTHKDQR